MTVIIGMEYEGKVLLCGDSLVSEGCRVHAITDKVFRKDDFVFGVAGSLRFSKLVQHSFTPPRFNPNVSLDEYMTVEFTNALRACLKSAGYSEKDNEKESHDSSLLIGFKGGLWKACFDYAVFKSNAIDAIGSGGQIALGALEVFHSENMMQKPESMLLAAADVAEKYISSVRQPFHIVSTET